MGCLARDFYVDDHVVLKLRVVGLVMDVVSRRFVIFCWFSFRASLRAVICGVSAPFVYDGRVCVRVPFLML